jgi:hypothetical protein
MPTRRQDIEANKYRLEAARMIVPAFRVNWAPGNLLSVFASVAPRSVHNVAAFSAAPAIRGLSRWSSSSCRFMVDEEFSMRITRER